MGKKIITPVKGIDVDSALNRRDNQSIYMAKNLRINNLDGNVVGEYSNIKGPNKVVEGAAGDQILQIHKIRDNIILFMIHDDVNYPNLICLIKEEDIPKYGEPAITLDTYYYYWAGGNVIIKGDFGFSTSEDIDVKSYYEDELTQKIYWTTADQPLRALNIIYSDNNKITQYSPQSLEASPIADLSLPQITGTISGNLDAGKIYYGYTLVNNIGAETNLSELSFPYHLTQSSENASNDYNYKGYGIDVNSKKGCIVEITDIPTAFSRVKLYSIHYVDDVSLPVIKLVYDDSASGSVVINDTGNALTTVSAEEFLAINNLYTKEGQLEIKNNRLFLANYTEEYFDIDDYADGGYWDARAYRFNSSQACQLKSATHYPDNTGGVSFTSASLSSSTVSKTHDCINVSNDITNPSAGENHLTYIYRKDGTTYGAEGLNVAIIQHVGSSLNPDDSGEDIKWSSTKGGSENTFDSHASPYNFSQRKTFKLEEVYRLSIQFKNSKGQLSYPKWVSDFKYVYKEGVYNPITYSSNVLNMDIYRLVFVVANIPIDPDTGEEFEWRILYVPIEEQDQSAYWGTFMNLKKISGVNEYRSGIIRSTDVINFGALASSSTPTDPESSNLKYLEFMSPDYCFGNTKTYSRIKGFMDMGYTETIGGPKAYPYKSNFFKAYNFSNNTGLAALSEVDSQHNISYSIDMGGQIALSGSDKFNRSGEVVTKLGGSYYYKNASSNNQKVWGNANKGRTQIIECDQFGEADKIIYGCAYVDNMDSRYGGYSEVSRKNNSYVAISEFNEDSSLYVYGDTAIGVFEYLRQIADNNVPYIVDNQVFENDGYNVTTDPEYLPGGNEVIVFPATSKINLKLRSDDYYTKQYTTDGAYLMQEYQGVHEDTLGTDTSSGDYLVNSTEAIFAQETDLYLYNPTYSRDQDILSYNEKPTSSNFLTEFKNRIIASYPKILGESSDSFLKIAPGTYIDVDGQYGEIREIKVFKDRLYFFQDNAIGIASVSEKSTTNTSDGSAIVLGELGVLSRYDYLTTENGINNRNHVGLSDEAMYVIDDARKELLKINQSGIEKISITKSVNSLVKSSYFGDSMIVHNRKYNEVLFFYDEDGPTIDNNALVFNELTGSFIGVQTQYDTITGSVKLDRTDLYDELISDKLDNLYVLNDGDYNHFNISYRASEITFIVPSDNENVSMYNVLEMIIKQVDSEGAAVDFVESIRVYSGDQDTGELDFNTSTDLKFGKYRTSKLRNYANSLPRERMVSDHIFVTIKTSTNYDSNIPGAANYRVFFRDLITAFSEYNYFG